MFSSAAMDTGVLASATLHVSLIHLEFVLDSILFLHLTWYIWVTKRKIDQLCLGVKKYLVLLYMGLMPLHLTFKPQYQYAFSPHCSSYISYGTSWENMHKYQDTACLVIISFVLVTCMFDQVEIL